MAAGPSRPSRSHHGSRGELQEADSADKRDGRHGMMPFRRDRGAREAVDLAAAQRLELALRLRPPPGGALAGQKGRLPVQLVVAASAARLQLTARVGLETLPPIAHATATTIALPRRVEGSRSPPHDEVGGLLEVRKERALSPFATKTASEPPFRGCFWFPLDPAIRCNRCQSTRLVELDF